MIAKLSYPTKELALAAKWEPYLMKKSRTRTWNYYDGLQASKRNFASWKAKQEDNFVE